MKQELLKLFPYVNLTGVAMLLFLFSFIAIIIRTYSPSEKKSHILLASLPLED